MSLFEYEITRHPAEAFREVVYFCSNDGSCNLEQISQDQIEKLESTLNERGKEGWELVQVSIGKNGILVFWKRSISEMAVDTDRGRFVEA
jgi:hypothetical protein